MCSCARRRSRASSTGSIRCPGRRYRYGSKDVRYFLYVGRVGLRSPLIVEGVTSAATPASTRGHRCSRKPFRHPGRVATQIPNAPVRGDDADRTLWTDRYAVRRLVHDQRSSFARSASATADRSVRPHRCGVSFGANAAERCAVDQMIVTLTINSATRIEFGEIEFGVICNASRRLEPNACAR